MATDYPGAVRTGTMAAARLHKKLALRADIESLGGNVDIFEAIQEVDLPLLLRPLQGLLGAYLDRPSPGVLVTTQRPMSIQRFTAAHELGHFSLKHKPSLDDESILRRMPVNLPPSSNNLQEIEADAFAVEFMLPRWLLLWHCARQGWTAANFQNPAIVYQLSLRAGASYEATCWTLARYGLINPHSAQELLKTKPRAIKVDLLKTHKPTDYRGDVWLLTERDAGTRIDGSRNDLFVIRVKEHSGGGYLWNIEQLRTSGFVVWKDEVEAIASDGTGNPVIRRLTAEPPSIFSGRLSLHESRPWSPTEALTMLNVDLDLTGPEQEGFSRAERRHILAAA